jgi:hypothetical protein
VAGVAIVATVAASWFLLTRPTVTRWGVDYQVTGQTIPVYVKATAFLQRHFEYQMIVSRVCAHGSTRRECVMALFDWTHGHVRPTPEGWRVIDDHVLNTMIRGHGKSDQMAAVFTTLATYAGARAFFLQPARGTSDPIISFVRLGEEWAAFDVERHVAFSDAATRPAPAVVPDITHAELQQPGPRVRYELRRLLGWRAEPAR